MVIFQMITSVPSLQKKYVFLTSINNATAVSPGLLLTLSSFPSEQFFFVTFFLTVVRGKEGKHTGFSFPLKSFHYCFFFQYSPNYCRLL